MGSIDHLGSFWLVLIHPTGESQEKIHNHPMTRAIAKKIQDEVEAFLEQDARIGCLGRLEDIRKGSMNVNFMIIKVWEKCLEHWNISALALRRMALKSSFVQVHFSGS